MTHLAIAAALGLVAGALSGLFGVGGGILFVPTLVLVVGLAQLPAQATSLAAMIPVVVVGAWRQSSYGNVSWKSALLVGASSTAGVAGGSVLAHVLTEHVLRTLFASFLIVFAAQLLWTVWRDRRRGDG